jgi:hypothetical protein
MRLQARVGRTLMLLVFAASAASVPVCAQESVWRVDQEHSIVRLSWGSGSQSTEAGVVRVGGSVVFDAGNPLLSFKVKPYERLGPNNSEASFKAKRSAITGDGKLAVIGDLTLTRIERSVTMNSSTAYSGADYGAPIERTTTHEVTLVFPGASLPTAQNGAMELVAMMNATRESFPEIMAALALGNWPRMIGEDEKCKTPSNVGNDYSGVNCTGTQVAAKSSSVAPATGVTGTGYYGFKPAVIPDGSQATLTLDFKLTHAEPISSEASAKAKAPGN